MIRTRPTLLACALLALLAPLPPAAATTFQMVADVDLVDAADAVVEGEVLAAAPASLGRLPATDYTVRVDRLVAGFVPGSVVVVRVPGGTDVAGRSFRVAGAPRFAAGQRTLLLLRDDADGTFHPLHLMLGVFHVVAAGGRELAVRQLDGAVEVRDKSAAAEVPELPRDLERFNRWIEDRARGLRRAADYQVATKFTLMRDTGDDQPIRWFQFDEDDEVVWRVQSSGQPGLGLDATVRAVKAAVGAWNDDPASNVAYRYAGTSAAASGLNDADGENVFVFGDPEGIVSDTFACDTGGVVAIGGPFYQLRTRAHGGDRFHVAVEADIVTNDGTECFFRNNPKVAEEVFAHELGHTLGLGHSDDREALMFANAHDDGRGARFAADDRAGLSFLYGDPDAGAPCTGSCLSLLGGRFDVSVEWENQFNGTTGRGTAVPMSDLSGFFYFTDPANLELTVKVLDFGDRVKVFYGQLTNLRFTLRVLDTRTGEVKLYQNGPNECGAIDDDAFPGAGGGGSTSKLLARRSTMGSPRWAHDQIVPGPGWTAEAGSPAAAGGTGTLEFARSAVSAIATKAVCVADSNTLCLLGGRFRATVTWRNQFNGASGTGKAAPISGLTGSFAFDDPRNLELLVKTLSFPDRFLVLYGSLSNLEYTLTVTDTVTGTTRTYRNPANTYCGGIDNDFDD